MLRKARDELIRKLNHIQSLLQVIKKPPDDKIFNLKSPNLQILKSLITLHLLLITVTTFSCRERVTPPDIPPYIPPIVLAVEDTSCTDAFIRIKTTKAFDGGVLQLRREGSTKVEITNLNTQLDTLVIDEGLLPKREYKYRAYWIVNSTAVDSSMELIVRTMDTTSHDFSWEITYLGDGGNSMLYDVAIINDTLAYAVGEIHLKDSLGNWEPTPYGLAVWNGRELKLRKLFAQYPGVRSLSLVRPRGIFAFSEMNIWFADADVFWWDGKSQLLKVHQVVNTILSSGQYVNKLWGSSTSNIYAVGYGGAIAHFDGVRWRRIESGTDVDLTDIWGSPDGSIVWACGYYDDKVGTYLFKYNGIKWELAYDGSYTEFILRDDSISGSISSVFTLNKRKVFLATNAGIYESTSNITGKAKRISFTSS
ncbi:MAG: hypothetical protein IGBAC_1071 [Ignavibacteriae bacterium]|nr:MAG: hypothetical protein IGBAC_1071 [Ignavibacteriota bacterium]